MKNKEELIKQIVILSIILLVVIVIAVALNIDKGENEITEITIKNNQNTDIEQKENKEMLDNLKGLLVTNPKDTYKNSENMRETIGTGIKEELKTNNDEIIQYEEIWHGDN